MTKAADGVNNIDVTDWVEYWAPTTVQKRNGSPGSAGANYGIGLFGSTAAANAWSGWSEDASSSGLRPVIVLTYEYGLTTPDTPTNGLAPVGNVASFSAFEADFSDIDGEDTLASGEVEVFGPPLSATGVASTGLFTSTAHGLQVNDVVYFLSKTGGSSLTLLTRYYVIATGLTANAFKVSLTQGGATASLGTNVTASTLVRRIFQQVQSASAAETNAATMALEPNWTPTADVAYRWHIRLTDNEGRTSAFSALTAFTVTNTAPTVSALSPSGNSYDSLNGVVFSGTFADADDDTMRAYQIQASTYIEGDPFWDAPSGLLWDTGKALVPSSATGFSTFYGGSPLAADTYTWRARVWDEHDAASAWVYSTVTLSSDFEVEPGTQTSIQLDPRAPWRIRIRDMFQSDGVTPTVGRGPGRTIAILENAKSTGASKVFNSPGEAHWTLPVDHPQIGVIEPKQTHYAIEFFQGDGWREVYAGLVWDFDATETSVVFTGIDYLALFDLVIDERFSSSNINLSEASGGSKYVDKTISYVVTKQLDRAIATTNSPVGFITRGTIGTMTEHITVWSTMQPCLSFVASLLDSHRAGLGNKTRVYVAKTSAGGYEVRVAENPGALKPQLRMRYGELVNGYHVVAFGQDWSSVHHGIGRAREGVKTFYRTASAAGISQATWGRIAKASIFDGVADENDLARRTQQAANTFGRLGRNMGLGLRTQLLMPFDGYDLTDYLPVDIQHGAVNTNSFGSGHYDIMAVAWEANDDGSHNTTMTLWPTEDGSSPDTDLVVASEISPQAEWQVGWSPPVFVGTSSRYWLDQTTGIVYIRGEGGILVAVVTADV
jgi:hypothetical protein